MHFPTNPMSEKLSKVILKPEERVTNNMFSDSIMNFDFSILSWGGMTRVDSTSRFNQGLLLPSCS